MSALPAPLAGPLRQLYARWIRLKTRTRIRVSGSGHVLDCPLAQLHGCRLEITGDHNRVEIGAGAKLWGVQIQVHGSRLHCRIGAHTRLRGGSLTLGDTGSCLHIGQHTTMTLPMIVAQEGSRVEIGDDCMVAYGSDLRCSDGHSVLDAAIQRRLNPAAAIRVGHHVWIGIGSIILKGVTLDENAIVAARSVVTKDVPAGVIVAGNPARVIRTGVTWSRERLP